MNRLHPPNVDSEQKWSEAVMAVMSEPLEVAM